jgi:hypothetical protein
MRLEFPARADRNFLQVFDRVELTILLSKQILVFRPIKSPFFALELRPEKEESPLWCPDSTMPSE